MTRTHRVAVIGGDGIGPEVVAQGIKCLRRLSETEDFSLETVDYDLGGRRYALSGEVLADSTIEELRAFDAIYLGAVGTPEVPPGVIERGLLLKLRFVFDQFVNLRPVVLYPGVDSPVKGLTPERCNIAIVRENTESLYGGAGGVIHGGTPQEVAIQESINTRYGVDRILRYAFETAQNSGQGLTLAHKTNVLQFAGDLWMRAFEEIGQNEYRGVERDYVNVDAACLYLVTQPERFGVIVTENLFGDILTDIGGAIQGGLGLAASANINPDRTAPSMFEPVHGSAPDIAGAGKADPVAAVLSARFMLEFLGERIAASKLELAVSRELAERGGYRPDGSNYTTDQCGDRLVELLP